MHTHDEDAIRDLAYALWIEAGSPEGDDQRFWHKAEKQMAENADLDSSEAKSDVGLPPTPAGSLSI